MASACLHLFFAKPNLIVNTDLLIFLGNYFSLICKAEILYPPQLYLKRFILYVRSLVAVGGGGGVGKGLNDSSVPTEQGIYDWIDTGTK